MFGRWSIIDNDPKIIFDAAHNEGGFESIGKQLSKLSYDKIFVLLSFVKGKKINNLISKLPSDAKLYFTTLSIERSMSFEEIKLNIEGNIIFDKSPKKILNQIKKETSSDDLILITGSNFIAKELFYEN